MTNRVAYGIILLEIICVLHITFMICKVSSGVLTFQTCKANCSRDCEALFVVDHVQGCPKHGVGPSAI